jgi:hypothetical protein
MEWASLFSGKYFAMIVVYADESGTGGIPKSGKEPAPGICGYLATPEMWDGFIVAWKAMLAKHDAPYFHFRELSQESRLEPTNRFRDWRDNKVDDFIYDMALVASTIPIIPMGGNASVKMVHGDKPTTENLNETYHRAFGVFFEDFTLQMDEHFPTETSKVSFFFEENKNETWISILNSEIKLAKKNDSRIGEWTSVSDIDERGIACQAADLLAYVNRQNNETIYEGQSYVPQRILDIMLMRQSFPDWHPFSAIKTMSDADWKKLIDELRGLKKAFEMRHFLAGTKPKPQYYPIFEHPYFNRLSLLCYEHKKRNPNLWA